MYDHMTADEMSASIAMLNEVYAEFKIKEGRALKEAEFYRREADRAATEIRWARRLLEKHHHIRTEA